MDIVPGFSVLRSRLTGTLTTPDDTDHPAGTHAQAAHQPRRSPATAAPTGTTG